MTKRALLMGSAVGGLTGVSNDIEAMVGWLDELGFENQVRQGPDATREGMLEGLARLARDARRGDAVLIYYSGHGGHAPIPSGERFFGGRIAPRAVQYLVPTDHDREQTFRGIFRAELSSVVREISDQTTNITMVLDCCHATDMVRHDEVMLKSVIEPWNEGLTAHVAWLIEQGYDLGDLPMLRNPAVVLLSACTATRQAFEYTRPRDGLRCSLFTDCLLDTIRDEPNPLGMTWDGLMRRVVHRVLRTKWYQRPQASGATSRCLFSERQNRLLGALTLHQRSEQWCLSGGTAAGVLAGDRYRIVNHRPDDDPVEVVVSEVGSSIAAVTRAAGDLRPLEPGSIAVPAIGGPSHQHCRIDGSTRLAEEVRQRIAELEGLGLAEEHDLAFTLEVEEHEIKVLDGDGKMLRWPWRDAPETEPKVRQERLDGLLEDLRGLLRGSELLSLARRANHTDPSGPLAHALEWGRVEDGWPRPLPSHGAELRTGDRIYISVENNGLKPIHISLLNIGVGRSVALLNCNEPEGIDLGKGETEIIGAAELQTLEGVELRWPDNTPPDGPRSESLILFVSRGPLPVSSWETSSWAHRAATRTANEESLVAGSPPYIIRHLEFRLHP